MQPLTHPFIPRSLEGRGGRRIGEKKVKPVG